MGKFTDETINQGPDIFHIHRHQTQPENSISRTFSYTINFINFYHQNQPKLALVVLRTSRRFLLTPLIIHNLKIINIKKWVCTTVYHTLLMTFPNFLKFLLQNFLYPLYQKFFLNPKIFSIFKKYNFLEIGFSVSILPMLSECEVPCSIQT